MTDFNKLHPFTVLLYFVPVLFFSVVFTHPVLVAVNVIASFVAGLCISRKEILELSRFTFFTALIITFINPFFQSRGRTVLFKYFGRNYTLEALVYGAVLAGIFLCSVNWFCCFGKLLTSDKLIFLMGGRFPNVCIILSTILGLVPYFSQKLSEIHSVQENLYPEENSRIKVYMRSFLIATDYAFEHAINMALSMKNRGFGTGKPTRYTSYKFKSADLITIFINLVFSVITIMTIYYDGVNTVFIPFIKTGVLSPIGTTAFTALLFIPTANKLIWETRWKYTISKI